ncbi:uncharacterized protein LOC104898983 [Beta vulgaris subsp. vulgaris]|uniref:uncharacterized protein LOC104898983 n=1 Tax=Beta vulgaris subsp. vulgaris TaxID=3555 RepID=UPI00053FA762|nr:uncharacterized protein LOC104898983 [Beta vulgaris subsp. vulgaris]
MQGCRKVLCVDGFFLKTILGGQLLAVVGRDTKDQMYPLCWAMVEGEINDSWLWFFNELKKVLGELMAVTLQLYLMQLRYFRGDEMKILFWNDVEAYNEEEYEDVLKEMEKVSPSVVVSFKAYNPKCFCKAFVRNNTKCDVIVNNMAETCNGYILNARTKYLIFMLKDIRTALMQRMVENKEEMEKSKDVLCPRIKAKLNKEKLLVVECSIMPSTTILFQVSHKLGTLEVDIEARSCTCKKWNITGVPYCHGCAAIFFKHEKPKAYVHECY